MVSVVDVFIAVAIKLLRETTSQGDLDPDPYETVATIGCP